MYRVTCPSCHKPYDATHAPECNCLHPVRSVRCPNCAACFCATGQKALDEFWRNAPPELWTRRMAAAPAPSMENPSVEEIKRPMVLFADDDPTSRAIASRVIASMGYGIAVATNGEQALTLAREYRPELIITDAMMPRLDGRELAKIVKSELKQTRVVIITSVYKDARYKSEAFREFGVDSYLSKPVNPGALRELVYKYLQDEA